MPIYIFIYIYFKVDKCLLESIRIFILLEYLKKIKISSIIFNAQNQNIYK